MKKFLAIIAFAVCAVCNNGLGAMQDEQQAVRQREALLGLSRNADFAIAQKLQELEHNLTVNGKQDAEVKHQLDELRTMIKTLQEQTKKTHKLRNTILILVTLAVMTQLVVSGFSTFKTLQTTDGQKLIDKDSKWNTTKKVLCLYYQTIFADVKHEFGWCCDQVGRLRGGNYLKISGSGIDAKFKPS